MNDLHLAPEKRKISKYTLEVLGPGNGQKQAGMNKYANT